MPFESALVVLIPEVESLVKSFRVQYDPSAALGIPAHVTILYPFKSPDELTTDVIGSLHDLVSKRPCFNVIFKGVKAFPDTLYLFPVPASPFRQLTELIVRRYPETQPYGGEFKEIVPHLTVAHSSDAQTLDEIANQFREVAQSELPIRAKVTNVSLIDNKDGYWKVQNQFSLGSE